MKDIRIRSTLNEDIILEKLKEVSDELKSSNESSTSTDELVKEITEPDEAGVSTIIINGELINNDSFDKIKDLFKTIGDVLQIDESNEESEEVTFDDLKFNESNEESNNDSEEVEEESEEVDFDDLKFNESNEESEEVDFDDPEDESEEVDFDDLKFNESNEESEEVNFDDLKFNESNEESNDDSEEIEEESEEVNFDDLKFNESNEESEEVDFDDLKFNESNEESEEVDFDDLKFNESNEESKEESVRTEDCPTRLVSFELHCGPSKQFDERISKLCDLMSPMKQSRSSKLDDNTFRILGRKPINDEGVYSIDVLVKDSDAPEFLSKLDSAGLKLIDNRKYNDFSGGNKNEKVLMRAKLGDYVLEFKETGVISVNGEDINLRFKETDFLDDVLTKVADYLNYKGDVKSFELTESKMDIINRLNSQNAASDLRTLAKLTKYNVK